MAEFGVHRPKMLGSRRIRGEVAEDGATRIDIVRIGAPGVLL